MLSVIVPAHNEQGYLPRCLNSILSQNTKRKFEILVINNASTDITKQIALDLGVKVIDVPKKGLSLAKNTGAKESKFDNLLFIDADCILPNDHVDKVCNTFSQNTNVVAFGGPYVYKDGGRIVEYITSEFLYFYKFSNLMSKVFNVPVISGGDFAIRKNVFFEIGGFNECLKSPLEAEDFELCKRLRDNDYEVEMIPELKIESSFRRQLRLKTSVESIARLIYTIKHLKS